MSHTKRFRAVTNVVVCTAILFVCVDGYSQAFNVSSDQWAATDALQRKTPGFSEAGPVKKDKYVAMFYWTWHTNDKGCNHATFMPVLNISQILAENPEAATDPNHSAWRGIEGGVFWWEEPLFGYYRTTDPWVLRKHAELLADAGVDAVFFDCTNGSLTWKSSYMALLESWQQARTDGVKTPRIAFLLPFTETNGAIVAIQEIYEDLYKPGRYKDLWFLWEGKPVIMAYPDKRMSKEILHFFTFRPGQPDYVNGPSRHNHWGWLENYPQHGYGKKHDGTYEQVTVGVAQNACPDTGGHCSAFNRPDTFGRSYTKKNGQDTSADAYLKGLNFQEQWSRAFELDPDLVWITGWNEWIAGRWFSWGIPFAFVDQYNWEKSRDIEPVKAWGESGDVYYLQLVDNVRRFKGMQPPDPVSPPKTIGLGVWEDWADVKPYYRSYKGNTLHRDHAGQGTELRYVNTTGRNDIVGAKVARSSRTLYFFVETAENLSPKSDQGWMRLFIDTDRNKTTGWQGYDFLVNRQNPQSQAIIERNVDNGWAWQEVGKADYVFDDNRLALQISRALLGLADRPLDIEFKWSDNMQDEGNIMDFYVNGDVAPGGRFNYVFTSSL